MKGGERRASSHELREAKGGQSQGSSTQGREARELREATVVRSGSLGQEVREGQAQVRKVQSEVNMRNQGQRRLVVTAGARSSAKPAPKTEVTETKQSLRETLKQSMTSGYCYRPTFLKNKS